MPPKALAAALPMAFELALSYVVPRFEREKERV
jgi:hypothetical protein